MKSPKFWMAVLAAGVVANILDFVVFEGILGSTMRMIESMNTDVNPTWYIIGDFVAVLVFMIVYDRVYSSFAAGPKGGATFGAYAGFMVSFPTWIFIHLMFKGFPYGLAWGMVVYGVIWGVIVGAVAGSVYKKA